MIVALCSEGIVPAVAVKVAVVAPAATVTEVGTQLESVPATLLGPVNFANIVQGLPVDGRGAIGTAGTTISSASTLAS